MLWSPRVGQIVRVGYRATPKRRGLMPPSEAMPLHGRQGRVLARGAGPGPQNVAVSLDDGSWAIVPRGNLFAVDEEAK
jgi:hypothetical protein